MSSEDANLRDRVVAITGGSGGLGKSLARHLLGAGARVVLLARDEARLVEAAGELAGAGSAETLACDVGSTDSVNGAIERVAAAHGRVDALVAFAGYAPDFARIHPARPSGELSVDAERVVDVDLLGTVRAVFAVEPRMRAAGRGVIVTIGNTPVLDTAPDHLVYQVARAGVRQLTAALAAQHRRDGVRGVRIHFVALGNVATGATLAGFDAEQRREVDREGWLHPDRHLAPIVADLVSGRLERRSGEAVRVDATTAPALLAELQRPYEPFVPLR